MVKASRVKLDQLLSTLKALFPIVAGVLFIGVSIYLVSIYKYQSNLNNYFVLSDDRDTLQQEYQSGFTDLVDLLSSIGVRDSNKKLEILDESSAINAQLEDLVDHMISDGNKMMEYGIDENNRYDVAVAELNILRERLAKQINLYIERQIFAANYVILNQKTESCYNKVNLDSDKYSAVVSQVDKCDKLLTKQIDYLSSSSINIEESKETESYLNSYSDYWGLVKKMYSYLSSNKKERAKTVSKDVKSQLNIVEKRKKKAEKELSAIVTKELKNEIESISKEIEEKSAEIEMLRSSGL